MQQLGQFLDQAMTTLMPLNRAIFAAIFLVGLPYVYINNRRSKHKI